MNEKPYLIKRVVERRYNPNYGDDRVCECGFPYRKHFRTSHGTISIDGTINICCDPSKTELVPDTWNCEKFREAKKLLTGKELRFAAENGLKVRYVEQYYNPMDQDMNYNQVTVMKPAKIGYYIGNSDINPENYKNGEKVIRDFPEGVLAVYKIPGVTYNDNFKKNDLVVISSPNERFNGQMGLVQEFRENSKGVWVKLSIEEDESLITLTVPAGRCEVIDTNIEEDEALI